MGKAQGSFRWLQRRIEDCSQCSIWWVVEFLSSGIRTDQMLFLCLRLGSHILKPCWKNKRKRPKQILFTKSSEAGNYNRPSPVSCYYGKALRFGGNKWTQANYIANLSYIFDPTYNYSSLASPKVLSYSLVENGDQQGKAQWFSSVIADVMWRFRDSQVALLTCPSVSPLKWGEHYKGICRWLQRRIEDCSQCSIWWVVEFLSSGIRTDRPSDSCMLRDSILCGVGVSVS